ncbi:MAG: FecR domain-containing protein [Betaproteobacteria bacterium]
MRNPAVFAITSVLCLLMAPATAMAGEAGQIKVAKGSAFVQRGGQQLSASAGMKVQTADVLVTGADGSIGVTFLDNSLVSTGPNSVFAIDSYAFDSTTHRGTFDGSLKKGTLAAVSGKMVKQAPESMRIRTPASILGVRGTEFVVRVDDPPSQRSPGK